MFKFSIHGFGDVYERAKRGKGVETPAFNPWWVNHGKPVVIPLCIQHGWKIPELNGGFDGTIIYKWWILQCHV